MSKTYKIGDLLRYDIGPTALMEVTNITEYDTGLRRYYGKQCMGGSTAAGCDQVRLASRDDLATWRKHHPEESVPEAAPSSVPVAVTEEAVERACTAWLKATYRLKEDMECARENHDPRFRDCMRAALLASGLGDGAGWVSVPGHILAMAERMRTQDNCATADPVFAVQALERIYGLEEGGEWEWHDSDGDWSLANAAEAAALDAKVDDGEDTGSWVRVFYQDEWRTLVSTFTRKGAEDYLAINAHNHRRYGEPRIYVESLWRCREMIDLREWLLSLPSPPAAGG